MNKSMANLPKEKQRELKKIIEFIKKALPVHVIILFGSYARGEWVEEKTPDGLHLQYQSDFDILIVVAKKTQRIQEQFEREINKRIDQDPSIRTPVNAMVHDGAFVNRRLANAQYFFADIFKEGIVLYDDKTIKIRPPKRLSQAERIDVAKQEFDYWFSSANTFFEISKFAFDSNNFSESVFLLHQTAERLFTCVLLVFSQYKPNTHNLKILRKTAQSLEPELVKALPFQGAEGERLFEALRKGYIDARYKRNYIISKEDVTTLHECVKRLADLTKAYCLKKIALMEHEIKTGES